jgi:hypothetical protein
MTTFVEDPSRFVMVLGTQETGDLGEGKWRNMEEIVDAVDVVNEAQGIDRPEINDVEYRCIRRP